MAHSRLRSTVCIVDTRFMCKVADYGLPSFHPAFLSPSTEVRKLAWTAPELLREIYDGGRTLAEGTMSGDVFSFAIIAWEVIARQTIGSVNVVDNDDEREHLLTHTDRGFRPLWPKKPDVDSQVIDLIKTCWAEDAVARPDSTEVRRLVKSVLLNVYGLSSQNMMDNLLSRLESYANNLEDIVANRTAELAEEKKRSERLLYEILPRVIADKLKKGERVEPEMFKSTTVYFSDVVGFTDICSESTPFQVVELLNLLYTKFDAILSGYQVYKVETIGDAYMIVSGLPERNGLEHARQIGLVSLHLLHAVLTAVKIPHRPKEQLLLRIGFHSGPTVAGVVGIKMPRYCLFGDTVNTASRMESSGEALRIHCSATSAKCLKKFGTFELEKRGEVDIKGKGAMKTYWVNACSEAKFGNARRSHRPPAAALAPKKSARSHKDGTPTPSRSKGRKAPTPSPEKGRKAPTPSPEKGRKAASPVPVVNL